MHQRCSSYRTWARPLRAVALPALAAAVMLSSPALLPRLSAQAPATAATPRATPPDALVVLAAARTALGGDARLSGVKTFTATGRTRRLQGTNLVPIEFEITCELPRRCVRRDEIPARESGPTTIGFDGDTLIQFPAAPAGRPGIGPQAPPPIGDPPAARRTMPPPIVLAAFARASDAAAPQGPPPAPPGRQGGPGLPPGLPGGRGLSPADLAAARVNSTKQDFAYLWLGMFAASFDTFPLTFTYLADAESPQGRAHVLDVRGPANFAARLFVHADTHLPVMVAWDGMQQGKPVEHRVYYAEYRAVDGMQFPFRLRRAAGPDTTEETTFDRFRVNARIDPRKFEGR